MTSQSVNHCPIHWSLKVLKSDTKTEIRVTVNVVPGKASEYQKKLFRAFFTRLIAECQRELKAESEAKREAAK